MKILHLGKFYSPFRGGMETVLQNLLEGLLDEGLQVRSIVSSHDGPQREEAIGGPVSGRKGVLIRAERIATLHSQPINPSLPVLLLRQIRQFRPHLVHLHLPNPLALAVWDGLSRLAPDRMPRLAIWHHADITRQKLGASLLQPWQMGIYRRCCGVCVSSRGLAGASPYLRSLESKVTVIPFGIAGSPWRQVRSTYAEGFLFVGRLVPYKGLKVLLDAVALCGPEVRLKVVGEGPLERWLRRRVQAPDLQGRVRFLGALPDDELARQMSGATGLVLPSLDASETFGLVQLEAMAAGLPVVASDLPTGVPDVGQDGLTGTLVPPGDARALARALSDLARHRGRARAMGERGRERFAELYTRQAMSRRVVRWYEKILNSEVAS
ncbi:hypothetical protein CSA17_05310 [bacterium DOLJORAL78_65_58]|nr:MAG: hypothetical protein CSB20_08110 [bacterium DOLZORAL124_64_63]PIE75849.1 MAG: hypothetical protein CSA17_05310 [bacterium DOLJORAL78_65_58]